MRTQYNGTGIGVFRSTYFVITQNPTTLLLLPGAIQCYCAGLDHMFGRQKRQTIVVPKKISWLRDRALCIPDDEILIALIPVYFLYTRSITESGLKLWTPNKNIIQINTITPPTLHFVTCCHHQSSVYRCQAPLVYSITVSSNTNRPTSHTLSLLL